MAGPAAKLIKDYARELKDATSADAGWYRELLRDFYNETIYEAAQELRTHQNNCGGECSDDLEGMTEDYD